jgi:S-adenosylmethionine synthetase
MNDRIAAAPRGHLFTSESVSEGHPDKLADRISDTILDAFLAEDPSARVACETFLARELVVVGGEFASARDGLVDRLRERAPELVRQALRDVGYGEDFPGIDPAGCEIRLAWSPQSPNIALGVDRADGKLGAGDQGMAFGFACDETPELLPLPLVLAHRLVQRQARLRRDGVLPWLRPDAKSQVTVRYVGGRPEGVETVVLSTQHAPEVRAGELREAVIESIVRPVLREAGVGEAARFLVNPTGAFEIGGPAGDAGLTGRKIVVDTYGGACPNGGGAFSGKDPTKVDRSAAYAARHIAKNVVASGRARRCTVQIAYAIGVAEPVSIRVETFGTGEVDESRIENAVREVFDLRPIEIIRALELQSPIYRPTASYGHFGRTPETLRSNGHEIRLFPWERTDRADDLRRAAGL